MAREKAQGWSWRRGWVGYESKEMGGDEQFVIGYEKGEPKS